jgi:hypothetical protein
LVLQIVASLQGKKKCNLEKATQRIASKMHEGGAPHDLGLEYQFFVALLVRFIIVFHVLSL